MYHMKLAWVCFLHDVSCKLCGFDLIVDGFNEFRSSRDFVLRVRCFKNFVNRSYVLLAGDW